MDKPPCVLLGQGGNIFDLMAAASKALKKAGLEDRAGEMVAKVFDSPSYAEALLVLDEYVDMQPDRPRKDHKMPRYSKYGSRVTIALSGTQREWLAEQSLRWMVAEAEVLRKLIDTAMKRDAAKTQRESK